jgi:hypothetical protein
MTNPEHDPRLETNEGNDQSDPEGGIDRDPATNTTPRSNPPVDERAVKEGEEKLRGIVNW